MHGKIIYSDYAAIASTITASTEATTYEKEFAVDNSPGSKWRTTALTGNILFDLGAAINIKAVFAGGTNITSSDTTWKIRAGATSGTTDYNADLTKATKSYLEIDQTYRYWKFDFVGVGGSYREFGKLALFGDIYEFDKNYVAEHQTGHDEENQVIRGYSGSLKKINRYQRETRRLAFQKMKPAQFLLFDETLRPLEECVFYCDRKNEAFYGIPLFTTGGQGNRGNRFDMVFNFEEAL